MRGFWVAVLITVVWYSILADHIIVHNIGDKDLYGAFFYLTGPPDHSDLVNYERVGETIRFPAYAPHSIDRPPRRYYWGGVYDRYLCVSPSEQALYDLVATNTYAWVQVGTLKGRHFYFDDRAGVVKGFDALSWNMRMMQEAVEAVLYFLVQEIREKYQDHPYSKMQASIRQGEDIAPEEKVYVSQRLGHARKILEQMLQVPIAEHAVPRIAFCGSGGGYRAMITMLGLLKGADQQGLLDASVYAAGVSGSTWAIAGFVQSQLTVTEYLQSLAGRMDLGFMHDPEGDQITSALLKQFAFTQNLSLIDFYGALLAQKLLSRRYGNPCEIDITAQTANIERACTIFPIYTAIIDCSSPSFEWVEFTPFEVGGSFLGASIPLWAFGRKFERGLSCDFNPPLSLGFCMGIWGSAMSANLKEIVDGYKDRIQSIFITHLLADLVHNLSIAEGRLSPAQIYNWTYGTNLPCGHEEYVHLLDAGIDCNLPLAPLLRPARNVDIIIILDATDGVQSAPELRKAEEYARLHNLKFPPIDYNAVNSPCSVHADGEDSSVPIVIYFPLMHQKEYHNDWDPYQQAFTNTFNFNYTCDQITLLSGLTEYTLTSSMPIILDAIKRVIARKEGLQLE